LVIFSYTGCLSNGQCSCIVIGCLLGAIAACCTDRWTLAAILLTLATTLKLYPVAMGLLLVLLYPRRFGWRFALTMLVAFSLPFLLRPGTMLEEHRRWWWHLVNDAKTALSITSWDQDLRLLLYRVFHLELSARLFMSLQVVVAGLIALVAVAGQRAGWPRRMLLSRVLGLVACWMTVLGMATEPSTYILLAPTLAWSLWETWLRPSRRSVIHGRNSPGGVGSRTVLVAAYLLFLTGYVFLWFPWGKRANSYGPEPLGGLLLLGYLLVRSLRELKIPHETDAAGLICEA
jgi:hypothetical protein